MAQNLFTAKRLFGKETSSAYSSSALLEGTIYKNIFNNIDDHWIANQSRREKSQFLPKGKGICRKLEVGPWALKCSVWMRIIYSAVRIMWKAINFSSELFMERAALQLKKQSTIWFGWGYKCVCINFNVMSFSFTEKNKCTFQVWMDAMHF